MSVIDHWIGRYYFLSNFHPSPLEWDDEVLGRVTYATVEHGFQAAKTPDHEYRLVIVRAEQPGQAKFHGRRAPLRSDWEAIKLDVMERLVRAKFAIPHLREKLLATGDAELIEGNTWGDRFWGCVRCRLDDTQGMWDGQNHLGKILMKVREELRR